MFRLTFLGTSAGVPTRQRFTSALAIQSPLSGRGWYLLDCGDGVQHRLLRVPLSPHDLAGVCISHVHGDHLYGLPGLLATLGLNGRRHPLDLIAPAEVWTWVQATRQLTDLHVPFEIRFTDIATLHGQPKVLVEGQDTRLLVSSHPQLHRVPSHALRFMLQHRQRHLDVEALRAQGVPKGWIWGKIRNGEDVPFEGRMLCSRDFVREQHAQLVMVAGGDNGDPSLLADACQGARLLVHEATYTQAVQDRIGAGRMHSSAQEVAMFAAQAGVPNLILTHVSPRHHGPEEQDALLAEARASYPGTVFLARDFDVYELDMDGSLTRQPARSSC